MSELFAGNINGSFIHQPCFPLMEIVNSNMELMTQFPELNVAAALDSHPGGVLACANDGVPFFPQPQHSEIAQQPFIDYTVSCAPCFLHTAPACSPAPASAVAQATADLPLQPSRPLQGLPTSVVSTEETSEPGKKRKFAASPASDCISASYSAGGSGSWVGEQKPPAKKNQKGKKGKSNAKEKEKPKEVVHVRARRGQATDSHSLAERVRREKINERLRCLQDLVPGCYKAMGMAVMLDEIINYVQSLQNQVEFLSMKLSAASCFYDFNQDVDAMELAPQLQNPRVGSGYGGNQQHQDEEGQGFEDRLLMMMLRTEGYGIGGGGCNGLSSLMSV